MHLRKARVERGERELAELAELAEPAEPAELAELAFFAQQAMCEHSLHICKVLSIWRARLSRRVPAPPGRRAEEGGAARSSRGGAREGRVGSEERGVPECCGISGSRDQVWSVT